MSSDPRPSQQTKWLSWLTLAAGALMCVAALLLS